VSIRTPLMVGGINKYPRVIYSTLTLVPRGKRKIRCTKQRSVTRSPHLTLTLPKQLGTHPINGDGHPNHVGTCPLSIAWEVLQLLLPSGTYIAVTAGAMRYTVTYRVPDHPGQDLARGLARRWPEQISIH